MFDEVMDITYCAAEDCPRFECLRNQKRLEGKHVIVSMADLSQGCPWYQNRETWEAKEVGE